MKDEEIYQLIEENKEETEAFYQKTHEQVESSIIEYAAAKKKHNKIMTRVLSMVSAFVLVISLAIVLPIVLRSTDTIWYSDSDLKFIDLGDCNLKQYAQQNGESFLYVNLDEIGEDIETYRFFKKDDESVTVYLQELFTHSEYGCRIELTVMQNNVIVDTFDDRIQEPLVMGGYSAKIYYRISRTSGYAQFEYEGYKYYLKITGRITESSLAEILDNMFNTQRAVA